MCTKTEEYRRFIVLAENNAGCTKKKSITGTFCASLLSHEVVGQYQSDGAATLSLSKQVRCFAWYLGSAQEVDSTTSAKSLHLELAILPVPRLIPDVGLQSLLKLD